MKFSEIVKQAVTLLQDSGRVSYRGLKLEFQLDDDQLDELKEELLYIHPQIVDDEGRGLIWNGDGGSTSEAPRARAEHLVATSSSEARSPEAERRQITVMFCDLVGSTALSEKLDPEDLREVMAGYQKTAGAVIERYEGHVAQYLGDGLMVYFGWPKAHEDDAVRALQSSLEIVEAVKSVKAPEPLRVRIGITTGPVAVGETGAGNASVPKAAVGDPERGGTSSGARGAGRDRADDAETRRRCV